MRFFLYLLICYVESKFACQEVLDSILIAYRLAEHPDIRLPVIVNLDGFYLSYTREPVAIPDSDASRDFVGKFDSRSIHFKAGALLSHASAVLGGSTYSYFRCSQHLAAQRGLPVYEEISKEFAKTFGRCHNELRLFTSSLPSSMQFHDGDDGHDQTDPGPEGEQTHRLQLEFMLHGRNMYGSHVDKKVSVGR